MLCGSRCSKWRSAQIQQCHGIFEYATLYYYHPLSYSPKPLPAAPGTIVSGHSSFGTVAAGDERRIGVITGEWST